MNNAPLDQRVRREFWDRVEVFPPVLCRLLARDKPRGRPLAHSELADKTGLSEMEVLTLSKQVTWKGVDVFTLRAFTEACGVDFTNPQSMKRVTVYLKGHTIDGVRRPVRFDYLRRSPEWETTFRPLMQIYLQWARSLLE